MAITAPLDGTQLTAWGQAPEKMPVRRPESCYLGPGSFFLDRHVLSQYTFTQSNANLCCPGDQAGQGGQSPSPHSLPLSNTPFPILCRI